MKSTPQRNFCANAGTCGRTPNGRNATAELPAETKWRNCTQYKYCEWKTPNCPLCRRVNRSPLLGRGITQSATLASYLIQQFNHAGLIGFDFHEMESDVFVELLEKWDPVTNQDRQDGITYFVG
jgi:hypothetical protein